MTPGVDVVGVKAHEAGEIVDKIIYQVHMVVGINPAILYPVATENLVIGESGSNVQGNAEDQDYYYAS